MNCRFHIHEVLEGPGPFQTKVLVIKNVHYWTALPFYRMLPQTRGSLRLRVCGAVASTWEPHLTNFPGVQEGWRAKQRVGQCSKHQGLQTEASFWNLLFWKNWLAESWGDSLNHNPALLYSTLSSQRPGIRSVSSFILSQDISITWKTMKLCPYLEEKLTTLTAVL